MRRIAFAVLGLYLLWWMCYVPPEPRPEPIASVPQFTINIAKIEGFPTMGQLDRFIAATIHRDRSIPEFEQAELHAAKVWFYQREPVEVLWCGPLYAQVRRPGKSQAYWVLAGCVSNSKGRELGNRQATKTLLETKL